jgi:KinB signaling pathway activation protein
MNLRKFWTLYLSTALVGLLIGLITALLPAFQIPILHGIIAGGFVSATTMMGFWAYLTLNFTMRNFVSFRIWLIIQAALVLLVFYDMVYFRYMWTTNGAGSMWPFFWYAFWPFVIALIVAWIKSRLSGFRSFIPAVFFMYVFTIIEWFVALKSGQTLQMTQIGIILLGCNTFMLLLYTRLLRMPTPSK